MPVWCVPGNAARGSQVLYPGPYTYCSFISLLASNAAIIRFDRLDAGSSVSSSGLATRHLTMYRTPVGRTTLPTILSTSYSWSSSCGCCGAAFGWVPSWGFTLWDGGGELNFNMPDYKTYKSHFGFNKAQNRPKGLGLNLLVWERPMCAHSSRTSVILVCLHTKVNEDS